MRSIRGRIGHLEGQILTMTDETKEMTTKNDEWTLMDPVRDGFAGGGLDAFFDPFRVLGYRANPMARSLRSYRGDGDHGFKYEFDVPGVDKGDVSIHVVSGPSLLVEAEHEHREYRYETTLPDTADFGKAKATLAGGVLTVTMPLLEHSDEKGRTIEID